MEVLEYIRVLDSPSLILLIITVISILLALISAILEFRDGRKTYLGFRPKKIKSFTSYLSVLLILISLISQTFKDAYNARKAREESIANDSIVHAQMSKMDSTIQMQDTTLRSVQAVLTKQIKTLDGQNDLLTNGNTILERQNSQLMQLLEIGAEVDPTTNSVFHIGLQGANRLDSSKYSSFFYTNPESFVLQSKTYYVKSDYISQFNGSLTIIDNIKVFLIAKSSYTFGGIEKNIVAQINKKSELEWLVKKGYANTYASDYNLIEKKSELFIENSYVTNANLYYKVEFGDFRNLNFKEISDYYFVMIIESSCPTLYINALFLTNDKSTHRYMMDFKKINENYNSEFQLKRFVYLGEFKAY